MVVRPALCLGVKVTERGALAEAVAEALAYRGPSMVEVITDRELIRRPHGPTRGSGVRSADDTTAPVRRRHYRAGPPTTLPRRSADDTAGPVAARGARAEPRHPAGSVVSP